jgi:hypothetical protein
MFTDSESFSRIWMIRKRLFIFIKAGNTFTFYSFNCGELILFATIAFEFDFIGCMLKKNKIYLLVVLIK